MYSMYMCFDAPSIVYPLLINCMESYDFEQFKLGYSAAKREYERVTSERAEVTMSEIRRVSKNFLIACHRCIKDYLPHAYFIASNRFCWYYCPVID